MKNFTKISVIVFVMILAAQVTNAQQQIPFQGMVSQGYGVAAWNANGTGPEPAATGHQVPFPGFGNLFYYGASRDYVTGNSNHACFAFSPDIAGFPNFTQALTTNGYTANQVKARFGLVTLGLDEEGLDWFVMDDFHHSSHKYSDFNIFELNGEPMLAIKVDYAVWSVQAGTSTWNIDFGYTPVINISGSSSANVQAVAHAFLQDLGGQNIRMQCESNYGGVNISGNGRNGAYYNIINGILSVGNPVLPFKGLFADNEGVAGWDADGTGPEPYGNGHSNYLYYGASIDYGGINSSPDACLGHFLEGSDGFLNTLLQLEYRGLEIGNLKMKLGLGSLGPDVQGEDWGVQNGNHWLNHYNNVVTIEINGEPILQMMADTNKMVSLPNHWLTGTSTGKMYNISENASTASQYVAKSFLRDLGVNYMTLNTSSLTYAGLFSGNGRDGGFYQINAGELQGVYENITFVPPGEVSGTWTAEGSPYYVDGHLEIANGETLIFEPGVKVAVRGPFHFTVQGCVKAEGTLDSNIVFTRSNPNLWWDGFDYDSTPATNDTSVFDYCLFEYGKGLGSGDLVNGGSFAIGYYDKIQISNSTFRYNEATTALAAGGAIALRESDILIKNCTFHNNYSPHAGGAICVAYNSNPIISKCVFYDNYATDYAGAVMIYVNANPIISNNLFFNNYADRGGALIFYINAGGILINNTIADNTANYGGAIFFYSGSSPEIINNIIWGNTASLSGNQVRIESYSCKPDFYYCDIEGGQEGFSGAVHTGDYLFNIDQDPIFSIEPGEPTYSLMDVSPCYNMGTPDTSAWFYPEYLPQTCLGGNTRIFNGRIDIGAYELPEIVGIHDVKLTDEAWFVYPNPFVEKVTIEIDLAELSEVTIELFNLMGDRVRNTEILHLPSGQNELSRNLSDLPDGVYFMTIRYSDTVLTKKLLKTR
jgi:predicted outer membrane repeat protein